MADTASLAILAAEFNEPLVARMIAAAADELRLAGATLSRTVKVPGSYEIPVIADLLLSHEAIDALVVLGYIERGETLHGEVMGHAVHSALVQLQLTYQKPVGIGIIGPGATGEQAEARCEAYARAAARAAFKNWGTLRGLRKELFEG
ncbi:MAG: 6,7-dimethyl-8-ribityllumazine synthase [Gemmataceae bacterium]